MKALRSAFFATALLLSFSCFSQKQEFVDSLLLVLDNAKEDTNKVHTLINLSKLYRRKDSEKHHSYAMQATSLARQLDYVPGIGSGLSQMADVVYDQGKYDEALELYKKAREQFVVADMRSEVAQMDNLMGVSYRHLGNYEEAIAHFLRSIKECEELGMKPTAAAGYNNIAIVYYFQNNIEKALEYFEHALDAFREAGDNVRVANLQNNIGIVHKNNGDLNKALEYYILSAQTWDKLGDRKSLAVTYQNIGATFLLMDNLDDSKRYLMQATEIREELNDRKGMAESYLSLTDYYSKIEKHDIAIAYAEKGLAIAEDLSLMETVKLGLYGLSMSYQAKKDYKSALEYYSSYVTLKDSLLTEENMQAIAELEADYDAEKKEREIELLKGEGFKTQAVLQAFQAENKTQGNKIMIFIVVSSMLGVLGLVLFFFYRQKKLDNNVLKEQKAIIEEKNKDITDSIRYAKRLQEAILPPMDLVRQHLPESFVFYAPKDIVSGDFYWFEAKGSRLYFAVADCTGHGVPGAMVSVVGYNALNRALNEFNLTDPATILNKVNELVMETFAKGDQEVRDGMDVALCCLELNDNGGNLSYAGANNPLYLIKKKDALTKSDDFTNETHTLNEVKPDKQPIGQYGDTKPFTTHQLSLKKGELLYIFSDGFADQFGGPKGKKFKYGSLKKLLLEVHANDMKAQQQSLTNAFYDWKGELEQLDDVCVIGIRV